MRGLKTQEGSKFEEFWKVVQNTAKSQGKVFFLDTGEGRELITDTMEIEDLSGWLVPENQADEFEKEWLQGKDRIWNSDQWDNHFRFAIWHKKGSTVSVEFKIYED